MKLKYTHTHTHTHTHTRLTALFPGLPGWAGTRKVKPIWVILKQETVSGSGISWAICKSAPRSRQITMPAPHHSVFYRPDALPATQPTASKHWRQSWSTNIVIHKICMLTCRSNTKPQKDNSGVKNPGVKPSYLKWCDGWIIRNSQSAIRYNHTLLKTMPSKDKQQSSMHHWSLCTTRSA